MPWCIDSPFQSLTLAPLSLFFVSVPGVVLFGGTRWVVCLWCMLPQCLRWVTEVGWSFALISSGLLPLFVCDELVARGGLVDESFGGGGGDGCRLRGAPGPW